jgi:hypothetical protein
MDDTHYVSLEYICAAYYMGAENVGTVSQQGILLVFCGTCLARIATVEVFNFLIEPTSVKTSSA